MMFKVNICLLRFTPRSWLCVKKIILEKTTNEIDKIDVTSLLQDIINYGEIKIAEYLIKESGVNSILKKTLVFLINNIF